MKNGQIHRLSSSMKNITTDKVYRAHKIKKTQLTARQAVSVWLNFLSAVTSGLSRLPKSEGRFHKQELMGMCKAGFHWCQMSCQSTSQQFQSAGWNQLTKTQQNDYLLLIPNATQEINIQQLYLEFPAADHVGWLGTRKASHCIPSECSVPGYTCPLRPATSSLCQRTTSLHENYRSVTTHIHSHDNSWPLCIAR